MLMPSAVARNVNGLILNRGGVSVWRRLRAYLSRTLRLHVTGLVGRCEPILARLWCGFGHRFAVRAGCVQDGRDKGGHEYDSRSG